ncbi:MAG TPA: hypothetical protein VGI74_07625 [Streptosporangiaceae bacterium]|jgi:hypothetical protein
MGEQGRLSLPCGIEPAPCPVGVSPESFELLHGPSDEVLVDARCDGVQLGAAEGSVVVDPAPHLVIDFLGEAGQVRSAAAVEVRGLICPYSLSSPSDFRHRRKIRASLVANGYLEQKRLRSR